MTGGAKDGQSTGADIRTRASQEQHWENSKGLLSADGIEN